MTPRALLAWSLSGLVVVIIGNNPVYRAIVLVAALNLLAARSRTSLRPLAVIMLVGATMSLLLNLAFSHAGSHVLFSLPHWLPAIGGDVTVESAAFGLSAGLGIASAAAVAAPLSMVLEPHQLVDALPLVMHRTGATLGLSMNLVPGVGRAFRSVSDADSIRGPARGRLRNLADLVVPVTLTTLEHSIQVAEAMESRGFGSGFRTRFEADHRSRSGLLVTGLAVSAAGVFVWARIAGVQLDWFPFPSLAVPGASLLLVAAATAFALPGVLWRSRAS